MLDFLLDAPELGRSLQAFPYTLALFDAPPLTNETTFSTTLDRSNGRSAMMSRRAINPLLLERAMIDASVVSIFAQLLILQTGPALSPANDSPER